MVTLKTGEIFIWLANGDIDNGEFNSDLFMVSSWLVLCFARLSFWGSGFFQGDSTAVVKGWPTALLWGQGETPAVAVGMVLPANLENIGNSSEFMICGHEKIGSSAIFQRFVVY